MHLWKHSKRHETKCHLATDIRVKLEHAIQLFSAHMPSDFTRKLSGGFNSLSYWKASELRTFMLYAGITVLKDVLPAVQYEHFLYLGISMRLLLTRNQEKTCHKFPRCSLDLSSSQRSSMVKDLCHTMFIA